MKKRNIFQNQSQELLSLFEQAASNAKVMCVPIDYAKKDYVPSLLWINYPNLNKVLMLKRECPLPNLGRLFL